MTARPIKLNYRSLAFLHKTMSHWLGHHDGNSCVPDGAVICVCNCCLSVCRSSLLTSETAQKLILPCVQWSTSYPWFVVPSGALDSPFEVGQINTLITCLR